MKKIVIQLEPKLPGNEKAMRERVAQLEEAIHILRNQLKLLLGSGLSLGPVPTFTCKRCGHSWTKKRFQYNRPRRCQQCKSPYWDRERMYEKVVRKRVVSPVAAVIRQAARNIENFDANAFSNLYLAPPPMAPLSLRERLAAMTVEGRPGTLIENIAQAMKEGMEMQQPTAETESDANCLPQEKSMNSTGELSSTPATDGAEPKRNESEEEIKESLADA